MKRSFLVVLVCVSVVLVGCSGGQSASSTAVTSVAPTASAQASAPVPTGQASSAPSVATSAPGTASASASATASPENLSPLDRLLPDEVLEAYAPSFPVDSQFDDAKDASIFAPLEKARPKDCIGLLQFETTPLEDDGGQLAGYATNYVYSEFPGPMLQESLFAYPSEAAAVAAFETAVSLVPKCKSASGEWPQQGTIIMDDGMNHEKLDVGSVKVLSPTAVILQSKPGYDGKVSDLTGLALAGDTVLWLKTSTYEDNSNAKRLARFTKFVQQAQQFASAGVLPTDAVPAQQMTLDCLVLKPLPYTLLKNYDEFYGKGRGRDLFVESRVAATNNCGKTVKGFKYTAEFTDELDESLLSGNASERLTIKPGQTRSTQPDRGWTIRAAFDSDKIKTFLKAKRSDVTVAMDPTKILFTDGTSLP